VQVQRLLPVESAPFVFRQPSGDYAHPGAAGAHPVDREQLRTARAARPGTTKIYVVSTGELDIRNPTAT